MLIYTNLWLVSLEILYAVFCVANVHLDNSDMNPSCEMRDQNDYCSPKVTESEKKKNFDQQDRSNVGTSLAVVLYTDEGRLPHQQSHRDFHLAGRDIHIQQDWTSLGVAAVVWDAAVVLCEYLEKHTKLIADKDIIELGAGTGLVGIVAAYLGGHVTITERKEAMANLQLTVESNMEDMSQVKLMELDWTKHESLDLRPYEVILGADIVYIEETFQELLETVLKLTGDDTLVLLSCRIRYQRDTNFLDLLGKHLTVSQIFYDTTRDIKIYSAMRPKNK